MSRQKVRKVPIPATGMRPKREFLIAESSQPKLEISGTAINTQTSGLLFYPANDLINVLAVGLGGEERLLAQVELLEKVVHDRQLQMSQTEINQEEHTRDEMIQLEGMYKELSGRLRVLRQRFTIGNKQKFPRSEALLIASGAMIIGILSVVTGMHAYPDGERGRKQRLGYRKGHKSQIAASLERRIEEGNQISEYYNELKVQYPAKPLQFIYDKIAKRFKIHSSTVRRRLGKKK